MVKAIYFFKRKPGMSVDQFRTYWRNQHAELVRKVPDVRRYVQSPTLDSGYRKHEPLYDGVAELWYDDVDTMRRIAQLPVSSAALADDANFMDMSTTAFLLTEEVVQKEGDAGASPVKLISFLTRKAGIEVAPFQKYWREIHGPLAAKIPQVRRYIQSHVRPSAYSGGRAPRYDGIAETWFTGLDAMRASDGGAEYRAVRDDEPNFLKAPVTDFIITSEVVVI